jgi:DnaB-like helicase C terminal domain
MLVDLPEGERQAAGLVMLLHRPELDEPWTPRRGEADLIVAKHQGGRIDVVTAVFQGQYCRFAPMASRSLQQQQGTDHRGATSCGSCPVHARR